MQLCLAKAAHDERDMAGAVLENVGDGKNLAGTAGPGDGRYLGLHPAAGAVRAVFQF